MDATELLDDENGDPPVTVAVRLISVVNDTMQHAGRAAFVRGTIRRGHLVEPATMPVLMQRSA